MKSLLQSKLSAIQAEMQSMETMHLYHLKSSWQKLRAKELLLIEIIDEHEAAMQKLLPLANGKDN